jgi:Gametolysin peptidase M11/Bacterial Ig domain
MNLPSTLRAPARLCLLAVALIAAMPAAASHVGEDVVADQQALAATDQVLSALRQWENAPEAVRAARLQQLVQRTAERKERLARLIERNPQVALSRLMPAALRERLPAAARALVEQDVQLRGEVAAEVASDVERGFSRTRFVLRANGASLELKLAESAGAERALLGWAGRNVALAGTQLDRLVLLHRKQDVQLLAADGTVVANTSTTPTMTPRITGNQNTLVILANFSDATLSCGVADVNSRVFAATGSSVNTSMLESSRNLVGFSGTVVGPFTIPYSAGGSCDFSAWGSAADAAARAAGFVPSNYDRVNYVTPRNSTCGWSGLAYMPGRTSWVQSCAATGVYTHELGHNLALHHAGSPTAEYGDPSDPMGGARNVRNNSANQVMAGWVPTGGVLDVQGGGSYAIAALGPEAGTQPQVLRLNKLDTNEKYYVSLRIAQGLDGGLPTGYLNTVAVHKASGTLPAKTTVLANLLAGQSFTDSVNGITLTNQGVSGSAATVGVTMSGGTCTRVAPGVTLNSVSRTASPGATVSFGATIVNNNPAACGSSTFNLAQTLPVGFSGSFSAPTLMIAAGSSASSNWNVASTTAMGDGTYDVIVTAAEDAVANSASRHATVVLIRDSTLPTVAFSSPSNGATLSGGRVTLSANASDASGIAAVEFYDGSKLLGRDTAAPYSVNWNLRKASKGAHTLSVKAIDAAGNAQTASIVVTLQ